MGTVIWTSPHGQRYVTHPGSALIFPSLCLPTGIVTADTRPAGRCADKTVMMPRRRQTRKQHRANGIAAERQNNHLRRSAPKKPFV